MTPWLIVLLTVCAAISAVVTYLVAWRLPARNRYRLAIGVWTIGCGVALMAAKRWLAAGLALAMIAWGVRHIVLAVRNPDPPPCGCGRPADDDDAAQECVGQGVR